MQPVSSRWAAALAGDHQVIVRVDVCPQGSSEAITSLPIESGSVTVDATQQTRRTCSITVPDPAYVPTRRGDLLHPLTGNELRPYRGIDYGDGTSEVVPLGVFGISKPDTKDAGTSFGIAVSGNDRSRWLSREPWLQPYTVAAGTALEVALANIIAKFLPWAPPANMAPSGINLPVTVFGATPTSSNPLADLSSTAAASGYEVFFDPQGVPVGRFIPDPTTSAPSVTFADGQLGTLVNLDRAFDESTAFDGVLVVGQGASTDPVEALIWADYQNPSSFADAVAHAPVPALPYVYSDSTITTYSQALATARTLLPGVSSAAQDVTLTAICNAAVDAGDICRVNRPAVSLINNLLFAISSLSVPLDATSQMGVTCRPQ